jgi:hypothetical protein
VVQKYEFPIGKEKKESHRETLREKCSVTDWRNFFDRRNFTLG